MRRDVTYHAMMVVDCFAVSFVCLSMLYHGVNVCNKLIQHTIIDMIFGSMRITSHRSAGVGNIYIYIYIYMYIYVCISVSIIMSIVIISSSSRSILLVLIVSS